MGKEERLTVVAVKERVDGNESIGAQWLETAVFDAKQPIAAVLRWAANLSGGPQGHVETCHRGGRLMLTVSTRTEEFK